ncbi:PDI-like 1-3 [Artemisia annua]|uniref:PDI-like 1-3 n=1 Tax=Artemisia annua TaxID=35608 RepID=A0A2U1LHE5_ARTAN|nr:PDI-like 1-3 [Artemisia annua]
MAVNQSANPFMRLRHLSRTHDEKALRSVKYLVHGYFLYKPDSLTNALAKKNGNCVDHYAEAVEKRNHKEERTCKKPSRHVSDLIIEIDSLVIAKMDGSTDEHPSAKADGYPTILFYPARNKSPIL